MPTIDEFLMQKSPTNSWLSHPGFDGLYCRSNKIFVHIGDNRHYCHPVLQIASVEATEPGNGAFTSLVGFLVKRDLAIYIENVHNIRFQCKLEQLGFTPVNPTWGNNYLFNYEEKLQDI